jgi:hypothetical protein
MNRGSEIVAIHPAPNEHAWFLGQAALREGSLLEDVGMVGPRGLEPATTQSSMRPFRWPVDPIRNVASRVQVWDTGGASTRVKSTHEHLG